MTTAIHGGGKAVLSSGIATQYTTAKLEANTTHTVECP